MALHLQGYNFNLILKYVKSERNVYDYSSRHPWKDLLEAKELFHYVNFSADGTTPNALTIDIIKKAPKMINFYTKL